MGSAFQYNAFQADAFQTASTPGGTSALWPTMSVYVAFTSNSFDTNPVWEDVSDDVMSINTRRGRTYEMNRVEAGTATVVLKNLEGDYWPNNTTGAHTGYVKPVKLIKIIANWNSTSYDMFTGYVEKWSPRWLLPGMKAPTIELTCADLQKNLSRYVLDGVSYPSELSGARIGRVLDDLGLPTTSRNLATGQSTLQQTDATYIKYTQTTVNNLVIQEIYQREDLVSEATLTPNQNAMQHIYNVLDTEVGIFYMTASGCATFEDRLTRSTATSEATLTDTGGKSYIIPTISYDDTYIYNDIRRTRIGGIEQVMTNSTSIVEYGQRSLAQNGLLQTTDDDVLASAYYYLLKFKEPLMRVDSIEIKPSVDPSTLYPIVLGFDISTRVTIEITDASIDEDYYIEGISHTWSASEPELMTTVWQLSNATNAQYPYFNEETLIPNGAGATTELTPYPNTGEANWEDVLNTASTYVYHAMPGPSTVSYTDYYAMSNMTTTGYILSLTLNSHCIGPPYAFPWGYSTLRQHIKIGGTTYDGAIHNLAETWTYYSDKFNMPVGITSTDMDAMEAGITVTPTNGLVPVKCDYVYVTVKQMLV